MKWKYINNKKILFKNIIILSFILIFINLLCLCGCQKSNHTAINKEELISKLNSSEYRISQDNSMEIIELIGSFFSIKDKCNDMVYANKNTNDWFMFFICDDNKKASDLWEEISHEQNIDNSSYQKIEFEKLGNYHKVILVDNTVVWAMTINNEIDKWYLNNFIDSIGYN